MAENKAEISPAEIPDSGKYSPIPGTTAGENPNKEEFKTVREPKRRKNCPTALDKFEELTPSNRAFSFSFDTKIAANSPESTPKFGSFNLGLVAAATPTTPTPDSDRLRKIPAGKVGVQAEEGEKGIEVSKEREGVGLLGLVDSINGID
uniref:Uncharacterized protein n=1 Tax=Vitis vinifera TaxID=29760 RepID=F6HQQ5_VITVI